MAIPEERSKDIGPLSGDGWMAGDAMIRRVGDAVADLGELVGELAE
jgi:hypothetical protein